jgi:prepilin signal peptidase PulO-like enzyme (type II secretory pathway)
MGDVKLLGAIGLYLGLYGMLVLFVGALLGTVFSVWATARDRSFAARPFPFGPFLSIAAVLVVLWGPWAVEGYLSLLGM